jgi:hypothetical protein
MKSPGVFGIIFGEFTVSFGGVVHVNIPSISTNIEKSINRYRLS